MAEAGIISAALKVDTKDLDKLRSDAKAAGKELQTNLGRKIKGSTENISADLNRASSAARRFGQEAKSVANSNQGVFRNFTNGLVSGMRQAIEETRRFGRTGTAEFKKVESAVDRLDSKLRRAGRSAAAPARTGVPAHIALAGGGATQIGAARAATDQWTASMARLRGGIGGVGNALGALGLAFGIQRMIAFGKASLDTLSTLNDFSNQVGISADRLIALRPILDDAGTNYIEFTQGIRALQRNLIDGSKEVEDAFNRLGISTARLEEIGGNPVQLIDELARAIGNMNNQTEKNAALMVIASRGGAKMALALEEIAKAGGVAALEAPLSAADLQRIDNASTVLHNLQLRAQELAAISFANIVEWFQSLGDGISFVNSEFNRLIGLASSAKEKLSSFTTGALDIISTPSGSGAQGLLGVSVAALRTLLRMHEEAKKMRSEVQGAADDFEDVSPPDLRSSRIKLGFGADSDEKKKAADNFLKSLADQVRGLQAQRLAITSSVEASAQYNSELLKQKAVTEGVSASSSKLNSLLAQARTLQIGIAQDNLAKQIESQNDAIQGQIVALRQGAVAAENYAIEQAMAASKLEDYGDAARSAADKQRDLNRELALAQVDQIERELSDAMQQLRSPVTAMLEGPQFNFDESMRKAYQSAIDKLRSIDDPRARGAALELAVKLKAEVDSATIRSIQTTLQQELASNAAQADIFGPSFSKAEADVDSVTNALQRMKDAGLTPANVEVQRLIEMLSAAKATAVYVELRKEFERINAESQALGGSIDAQARRVDALKNAIQRLIADGTDSLAPSIQKLKQQLQEAQFEENLTDAIEGISGALGTFLEDIKSGDFESAVQRLASNIERVITDTLVTRPIEDWIRGQLNQLFKVPPPDVSGLGSVIPEDDIEDLGFGSIEAILEEGNAAGIAAIQTTGATAVTGITQTGATASTSISALQNLAVAAIEAIKVEAIAAIQAAAAAAQGRGSSGGLLGLFGGGSSAEADFLDGLLGTGGFAGVDLLGAAGGSSNARSGQTFLVGEKGPEIFQPRASGMIIPNHQISLRASGGRVFAGDSVIAGEKGIEAFVSNASATTSQATKGVSSNTSFGPFHFHGVNNMDSFKRSRGQLLSDLGRTVQKAQRRT